MKYTIEGFNQELLVKWNLDSNDAIILRWFIDFYHSGKMAKVEYEGETYLWVNYQACINDLPIMRITNKQVLARHFKKFVKCGLMKSYISRKKGIYTCFKLIESMYVKLIEKPERLTQSQRVDLEVDSTQLKSQVGTDSKVETKDYSINDSSIKSNNNRFKKPTIEEIKSYCRERSNSINAEQFYDFYESKNWMIGKNKMKNWQAAVRTWERNQKSQEPIIEDFEEIPYWKRRGKKK